MGSQTNRFSIFFNPSFILPCDPATFQFRRTGRGDGNRIAFIKPIIFRLIVRPLMGQGEVQWG